MRLERFMVALPSASLVYDDASALALTHILRIHLIFRFILILVAALVSTFGSAVCESVCVLLAYWFAYEFSFKQCPFITTFFFLLLNIELEWAHFVLSAIHRVYGRLSSSVCHRAVWSISAVTDSRGERSVCVMRNGPVLGPIMDWNMCIRSK